MPMINQFMIIFLTHSVYDELDEDLKWHGHLEAQTWRHVIIPFGPVGKQNSQLIAANECWGPKKNDLFYSAFTAEEGF